MAQTLRRIARSLAVIGLVLAGTAPGVHAAKPPLRPQRRPPLGARQGRRPEPRDDLPKAGYGSGAKRVTVDASRAAGRIASLLGTNRGPYAWQRRSDRMERDLTADLKRFGIDFIRTHDYYGPTDWYVMFPDWDADPSAPASYDFRSSDVRIRAICENGFACLFRLGTSWRGPATAPPIHDPPGTRRDGAGRVVHAADRDDFRTFARVCVGIVRHYTEGWADGYRYPIRYWEIWNEPDLREQFWAGTVEQFDMLYEEVARALKRHNPDLKVGGVACAGGVREIYVERFIRRCRDRSLPLDFFTWHSYGGRDDFNPYLFGETARRVRKVLDDNGFAGAEAMCTEWNAGIKDRIFSHTPAGAAFYASTLTAMLDGGTDRAFQYCGDNHPGLGLFERTTNEPKICAYALAAWKAMLETPHRLVATGADKGGYTVLAGRDATGRRVRILVSDFQSGHDGFDLRIEHLPWTDDTPFAVTRRLLDGNHRLAVVEETTGRGRTLTLERPLAAPAVCLIELVRTD